MYLIFDTETTGLPKNWKAPITDVDNWPRCVQIAWQLLDDMGELIEDQNYLIRPDNFEIPYESQKIHGISTELALEDGEPLDEVLEKFNLSLEKASFVIGHNIDFDANVIGCEFYRKKIESCLSSTKSLDTCTEDTALLCKLPGGRGGKYKFPTLVELHEFLFDASFKQAHNATADVEATARCFLELIRIKEFTEDQLGVTSDYFDTYISKNPDKIQQAGIKHVNLKKQSEKLKELLNTQADLKTDIKKEISSELDGIEFVHLHNHTQFSVLQSTMSIKDLIGATSEMNMPAVALTDNANMMGAFRFVSETQRYNRSIDENQLGEGEIKQKIKPIVGCVFYVCEDHLNKNYRDNGYHVVFLAKNKNGYNNLAKLSSIAYTKGFYYVPRIDKTLIEKYKDDIIVLTGNLMGEVSNKILNIGQKNAEEALLWWKEIFKDDLYIEIMRHNQEDEDLVNKILIDFSRKHDIKIVATNNNYYKEKSEANAHDILLCIKEGEKLSTPIGKGRGFRYGLPNQEYYYKSSDEMKKLFYDLPKAINNVFEVVNKIEEYTLSNQVLLPKFDIPPDFIDNKDDKDDGKRGENNYLRNLTYIGAKKRYGKISPELEDRIEFELETIKNTGYPGYFLIVEDFIREAREMNVSVGPGRGSAAGSVVAYSLWITNIDPIKYDLLFERFLNPDRISMPDIDIDFDDEGRGKVIEYVIKKYGESQVAQIITYGTMAAKSSIRDTARVLDLPLNDADRIAKLVPNMTKLSAIFETNQKDLRNKFRPDDLTKINQLLMIADSENLESETIKQARVLEGSLRNTGTHACGVIITPDDITNFVPIATAKDSDLNVTQFDNAVVEQAGLLKMDFLGLKTLTLIKNTVKIVKAKYGIILDPDNFPLDDKKTFELFQNGETVGIFQYESAGMQKHLKDLKPTVFDDLIAMNALYRPGPMEYIPSFIRRKHGDEKIVYDFPEMEEYLKDTYGITVYQEQVMLLSQKLGDFTKGEADILRKAMGKKQKDVLDKMKPKFLNNAKNKGLNTNKIEKIWKDWEAFASYAFNKSHSTCYAWIAYQTAYLKANYPAEYMASVLSNNMNDIKSITFFMGECKRMKLDVLGPDINESYYKFAVNKDNAIRFGMGAIKGVGASAVNAIVSERKKNGNYTSIFDLSKRVDLRAANKKAFDSLAVAGAFDCFNSIHRAQYFNDIGDGITFIEKIIKHGGKFQANKNSAQVSLFQNSSDVQVSELQVPDTKQWDTIEKLSREREVIGIYISGHPLDDFKVEMESFCNANVSMFKSPKNFVGKELAIAGVITDLEHRVSRQGKGWASFTLEDYVDSFEFRIFGEDYLKFKHFLILNNFIHIKTIVVEGWKNKETGIVGEPRIQYKNFKILQDVVKSFARKLSIQLNLDDIEETKIDEIKKLLVKHKGDHNLSFLVYDEKEKIKIDMKTTKHKINISPELLELLDQEKIYYKLN
ncbi:MAG: DNA polymerase III subunit alpha [Flavobacteriaceae bacterium]|nr:DNA polymerase III subunit alpha [Flavobacteriaceae bacterium]MBT5772536.1 DNA polymerase III subunit alpha [Flavobacteriaceae bacterium]